MMIHFLYEPKKVQHTDRSYLNRWFNKDTLIITDIDINEEKNLEHAVNNHWCKNVVVDLSHNSMPLTKIPDFLRDHTILSSVFTEWYRPTDSNVHYFPLWFWHYSIKSDWLSAVFSGPIVLDTTGEKTMPMMCLNRNPHPHRIQFKKMLEPILEKIVWTFYDKHLSGDTIDPTGVLTLIDISVRNEVYNKCAVNIVTETEIDVLSLSEKSCKPFVAQQIPLLVGPHGSNQFLSDIGLDMFSDLIPWHTWDSEPDSNRRMQQVAEFAIDWFNSGRILSDYQQVKDRVDRNKQYFHSAVFREQILKQMQTV